MESHPIHYKFLDIVRLYCALLVILIHLGFGDRAAVISCLARQAVPFFFLVSGFFFTKKIMGRDKIRPHVLSYVKRTLLVYFFWILLWLPSLVSEYYQYYSQSPLYLTAVLLRRLLLAGIAPYWYLLVLAEGILLLSVVVHYKKMLAGAVLCAAGLVLSVLFSIQAESDQGGLVYRAFYTVFSWNNNVIMSGFPLLYLGAAAAMHETRLRSLNSLALAFLYLLAVGSAFALFLIRGTLFSIPFGPIQALILFLLCISDLPFQARIPDRICAASRNLSSVVFLTHTIFLTVLGKRLQIWNASVRYLAALAGAAILLLIAKKLNRKALNTVLMIKTRT